MTNFAVPARIETFRALVLAANASATVTLDAPDRADGAWMIDVRIDGLFLPTEWSQERGFGLYTTLDLGFGERPNELHREPAIAAARFLQIARDLKAGQSATLTLARLRELHGLNQTELAEKLGVGQAAVSKLESRSEAQVGTLARAVRELGGELVLTVRFPAFQAEFGLGEGEQNKKNEQIASISRLEAIGGIHPDSRKNVRVSRDSISGQFVLKPARRVQQEGNRKPSSKR
jgi:transcriptional regulator with XRE-family HTH domain